MDIEIALSKTELVELLNEFTPIRIHMTPTDEDRRWLELERPSQIDLVPGRGVRVVTDGRLRYELAAGLKVPATIKRLQLMLIPEVVQSDDSAHRLAFKIEIEEGDLKHIPNLIDDALVAKVNDALTPRATNMTWDFGQTLAKRLPMPERLEPLSGMTIQVTGGAVRVEQSRLAFTISLDVDLQRSKPRPTDD